MKVFDNASKADKPFSVVEDGVTDRNSNIVAATAAAAASSGVALGENTNQDNEKDIMMTHEIM